MVRPRCIPAYGPGEATTKIWKKSIKVVKKKKKDLQMQETEAFCKI